MARLPDLTHPTIVQIVPSLPPEVGGVGDYAFLLAEQWQLTGKRCEFLTISGGEAATARVQRIRRPRAGSLSGLLQSKNSVVLHHSPYGYARYGLCTWLAKVLPRWRQADPSRRFILIMHEVAADGPPWSTAYWAGVVQELIAKRLLAAADAVFTSSEATRALVAPWAKSNPVTLAVFSNVGETRNPAPPSQRSPHAVAFGGAWQRERLYKSIASNVATAGRALAKAGILRIVDIGPNFASLPSNIAGVPVEQRGVVTPAIAQEVIANARYGLVDYPHHVITKSGIFAAYVANGTVCLNLSRGGALPPDLCVEREFLTLEVLNRNADSIDEIAAAAQAWYSGHSLQKTAIVIARSLILNGG